MTRPSVTAEVVVRARDMVNGDAVIACPHCRHELVVVLPALVDILSRDTGRLSLHVDLNLTKTQGLVFDALNSLAGQWVPHAALGDVLWRGNVGESTLKSHISHLRDKLRGTPYVIYTRKGVGYRLVRQESVAA